MRSIRPIVALSLVAALSACDDYRSPTSPPRPGNLAPTFGIFDGAHGGGNTRFFFLPPMVSTPAINAEFHPGLRPRVDICEVENGVCKAGPTFKSFSAADVKVSTTDKHYHVNWDTKSPDVDPAKTYRIQVLLGDTPIGFADVDPVANGSQLKQVNTNEYIPLVDGRTLPIKFFLGRGVTCETNPNNCAEHTVTSAVGGEFPAADERFWLKFPANVFPAGFEEVTITVERKPVPKGKACHTLHLQGTDSGEDTEPALAAEYEGCYRVTMDRNSDDFVEAGGFQRPVTVAMCLTGIARTNQLLRIYKSDPQPRGLVALEDADPAVIAGFDQTCEGFEPTPLPSPDGPIGALQSGLRNLASAVGRMLSPKSLYAIDLGLGGEIGIGGGFSDFGWGIEGSLEARGPVTRTTTPESSQDFSVSVHGFLHHHDEPETDEASSDEHGPEQSLAGVDVRFELLLDGTVVGSKVVTSALEEGDSDENGHVDAVANASFDFAAVGLYSVRATLAHSGRSPVSFAVNVAEATGSITGLVSGTDESALDNAQVRLVGISDPSFQRSTTTDDGEYSFASLPDGRYSVAAAAIGFTIARQEVVLDGEGRDRTVNFTLLPTGGIVGVVTNAVTGAAIAGASVQIVGTETRTVTNSDGRFSFPNLRAGSYALRTTFVNFTPKTTEVTVGADQAQVSIALLTAADLAVTSFTFSPAEPTTAERVTYNIIVTNRGGTMSEAGLATLTESRDGEVGQVNPNLVVPPVGPGLTVSYTLLAADLGAGSRSTTFTVNTGTPPVPDANASNNAATVTFTVTPIATPTGTVVGQVTDASTGLPLSSAAITVVGVAGQWFTNVAGNYSLQAPIGLRTLRASRLGYATTEATITVTDGQVTLNFALQPAPNLPGGGTGCTVNCTTTPP